MVTDCDQTCVDRRRVQFTNSTEQMRAVPSLETLETGRTRGEKNVLVNTVSLKTKKSLGKEKREMVYANKSLKNRRPARGTRGNSLINRYMGLQ